MSDIVLATLNAKYIHASFGLRYLMANLGLLSGCARIREFDINQRPLDIAERILAENPKILGLGIYLWNTELSAELVEILKRIRPDLTVILGGPEVSYETESQRVVQLADYVITGEGDLKFAEVCNQLLRGEKPPSKILHAEPPEFSQLAFPYDLYDAADVAHRIIYVEASRGCPYSCEFCLSSLDAPVRQAPLPAFLEQIERLMERGVKQFKFADRSFNLDVAFARAILEFLLERYQPGYFFHFEMVPDRLPEPLREIIAQFPPGALQFEIGVQTFNPEVADRIHRRQNYAKLEENFRFLRSQTGVYIHADLIAGLPGESLESFAAGFNRLVSLRPQEIQFGILKRLRGTPIARHDEEWQMVYNSHPPYEILQNRLIGFSTMQQLRRFARYWDLVANSGNFVESTSLIWSGPERSPFAAFLAWSRWLHSRVGRTDSIALMRLMELLFQYLAEELKLDPARAAAALWQDYRQGGHRDKPGFLKDYLSAESPQSLTPQSSSALPKRQARRNA
jgi:radical SAM superfamily enzyme YgiQ (UPF0313 family)